MKPITQTKLHDPETGARGNWMAAAIASVLEIDLEAVPQFEEMAAGEWHTPLFKFLAQYGLELEVHTVDPVADSYYLANGKSPRGVYHAVVWLKGALAHDPHPSRAGIERAESFWMFVPLESYASTL